MYQDLPVFSWGKAGHGGHKQSSNLIKLQCRVVSKKLRALYSVLSSTLNRAKSIWESDMQYVWHIPLDSLKCHFVISTLLHLQLPLQLQQRTHCAMRIK